VGFGPIVGFGPFVGFVGFVPFVPSVGFGFPVGLGPMVGLGPLATQQTFDFPVHVDFLSIFPLHFFAAFFEMHLPPASSHSCTRREGKKLKILNSSSTSSSSLSYTSSYIASSPTQVGQTGHDAIGHAVGRGHGGQLDDSVGHGA